MKPYLYKLIVEEIDFIYNSLISYPKPKLYNPAEFSADTHVMSIFSDEEGSIYIKKVRKLKPGEEMTLIRKYPPNPATELFADEDASE